MSIELIWQNLRTHLNGGGGQGSPPEEALPNEMRALFVIRRFSDDIFRWQLRDRAGDIIQESSRIFASHKDCREEIELIRDALYCPIFSA